MSTTIHINRGRYKEIRREPYGERWCFVCRTRCTFSWVVMAPVGISYYGPHEKIVCDACKTQDGDCFPGTYRESCE